MPFQITRKHEIHCGHRVCGHEGKCRNLHGHAYVIHFTCEAEGLDHLGRVIDFGLIKSLLCRWLEDTWGGFAVLDEALARANEIKLPIGKRADVERLAALIAGRIITDEIWLQPLSRSQKATELCLGQAIERNWKLSVQIHQFFGLR